MTMLSKGTVIDHYRIVEKIGAGGIRVTRVSTRQAVQRVLSSRRAWLLRKIDYAKSYL
jgi:hypothetical protein